ncbi:MAG: sensor histidine kinase [Legionellales bacterium]
MNDQYIIPLFVAGSLLLTLFAFFLVAYLIVQKRKQNTYQLEKQRMIFDHQTNILRTKLEEKENTMDQISKELHDNVKSVLGYAQMSMYNIADLATNNEQALIIDKTNKIIGDVIDDLHNISHSLNSNFIKNIGLVETITKDLEHIQLSKNITYTIEVKGDVISLDPEKELHIYRIAQEAIQNSIKHAKATNLSFMLNYEPDLFTMKITDNGIGFDKNKIYEMKGLGFLNMFQRARYVHGSLKVESVPNNGSAITLTIKPGIDGANN